jgi:uncharacterized protein (TIGR03067 family)
MTATMKYLLCLTLGLAGCASVHASVAAAPSDVTLVQGSWTPAAAELAGRPMPAAVLKRITLKLANGRYDVSVGGAPDQGTYTLDVAATPKGMTVTGTEGPNRGKTYPAIYELRGDTLRICYDLSGTKRPVEFKSVAGTQLYFVTYTRSQP